MTVSSNNIAEEVKVKSKRVNQHEKFERYLQLKQDLEAPFYGHEFKTLRRKLGFTVPEMAKMLNCSISHLWKNEQSNGQFVPRVAYKLHQIKRLTDQACADLRDRFEMPDFRK